MTVSSTDLHYLSIADLGRAYAAGQLSPVEVVDHHLARIEQLDARLNAFITVTADRARREARASEQAYQTGTPRSRLEGVPIALKDLYDTATIRTTGHSALLAERVPERDSTCARQLADAGSVLLGKLSMHEFAFGPPDPNGHFPPARNPWDLERVPGGSSSGSGTALAAGLCTASLGSDTGGSIRGPASLCGIAGLKPTYGLCSRAGVLPLAWTLDHTGPMARTVEDCAILLQAIAAHDPTDPASARVEIPDYTAELEAGVAGLRVGAPLRYLESLTDLARATFDAYLAALSQLEELGAVIVPVDLPEVAHHEAVGSTILIAEAYAYHEADIQHSPGLYTPGFLARVRPAALLSAADYLAALRGRARIKRGMDALMAQLDLLALPTSPSPARTFAEELAPGALARTSFTRLFNITGQPALSVPCGFTGNGLPIGLQLAGRAFDEPTVLRAGHTYERATRWHTRRPPLQVS